LDIGAEKSQTSPAFCLMWSWKYWLTD